MQPTHEPTQLPVQAQILIEDLAELFRSIEWTPDELEALREAETRVCAVKSALPIENAHHISPHDPLARVARGEISIEDVVREAYAQPEQPALAIMAQRQA